MLFIKEFIIKDGKVKALMKRCDSIEVFQNKYFF